MKQQEFDQVGALKGVLENLQVQRALIFTGKRTFALYKELILPHISCLYDVCDSFEMNPKKHEVDEVIQKHNHQNYQIIIALGGGSAIDFAKLYKHFSQSMLPLVAIPTTAGTGSEATQFAVYYEKGEKESLDNASVLPEYAIVDARFLLQAPQYLKACSAIDAYCQAIESYWAIRSTEESKGYARKAMQLAKEYIENFVLTQNEEACKNMALSSNLAGKAINISRTTAAHALSYKMTSLHGLPHGHAVALSMADLFDANQNCDAHTCQDARGADYVKASMQEILEILAISDFRAYWCTLLQKLQLSTNFAELGISDKESLINGVNKDRLKNNPKNLSKDLPNFWKE